MPASCGTPAQELMNRGVNARHSASAVFDCISDFLQGVRCPLINLNGVRFPADKNQYLTLIGCFHIDHYPKEGFERSGIQCSVETDRNSVAFRQLRACDNEISRKFLIPEGSKRVIDTPSVVLLSAAVFRRRTVLLALFEDLVDLLLSLLIHIAEKEEPEKSGRYKTQTVTNDHRVNQPIDQLEFVKRHLKLLSKDQASLAHGRIWVRPFTSFSILSYFV